MPNFPGPLQGVHIITEDDVEVPLMGTEIHFVFLDGAGIPAVRRILEKSPLQHGASDRGFRLEPRRMTLQLFLDGANPAQTDSLRDRIAYLFAPTNSALRLKATRDDGQVRQIDCYVDGAIEFAQSTRIGAGQPVTIPLIAPDPTWYEPTQIISTKTLTDGVSTLDLTIAGMTWDDWPIIDITGPLDAGFILQHTPGDELLQFSSAIPNGETFRIDLRPGQKTVLRTSDNANRMSYLNPLTISAFSEMRILGEKATRATNAFWSTTNTFTFNAAGTSGASKVDVRWYRRYLSL